MGLYIVSELLHVLFINTYEKVCRNCCFIFCESIDIKKNVKKSLVSTYSEKRFVFYLD